MSNASYDNKRAQGLRIWMKRKAQARSGVRRIKNTTHEHRSLQHSDSPKASSELTALQASRTMRYEGPGNFGGPGRVILFLLAIFLISQFVAALFLEVVYGIIRPGSQNILDQSAAAQFFYILLAESLAVGLVVLVLRRRALKLGSIGFGRRPGWRDLKLAALGFVAFYGLLFAVTIILTLLIPSFNVNAPQDVGFNVLSTPLDRLIALVALVILPPLGEETLMRGYLFSGLRSRLKFWPALLVTSLLFGLAHLSTGVSGALWAAGVDTFILSVVLVYLREKTAALYAPIMVHGLNNLVAFFAHFHV